MKRSGEKEMEEAMNKLFASDEVDRQTALDSYQRVSEALEKNPEALKAFHVGLNQVWMRRMIYLEKSLEEKSGMEKMLEKEREDLRGLRLGLHAKEKESEQHREMRDQVWREAFREREEQARQLEALQKNLRESNEKADLYLSELLQLRKLAFSKNHQ